MSWNISIIYITQAKNAQILGITGGITSKDTFGICLNQPVGNLQLILWKCFVLCQSFQRENRDNNIMVLIFWKKWNLIAYRLSGEDHVTSKWNRVGEVGDTAHHWAPGSNPTVPHATSGLIHTSRDITGFSGLDSFSWTCHIWGHDTVLWSQVIWKYMLLINQAF